MNPVFMLDEIDKIGVGFQGDPAAALLEVLDPAQNHSLPRSLPRGPLDLSQVLFIATANQLGTIHPALLDRMEIISLAGYTEEEKLHIARRYLIPRQLEEHGLTPSASRSTTRRCGAIIAEYTREAGVRSLERQIGAVARKIAARVASRAGRTTARRRDDASTADAISGLPRAAALPARGRVPHVAARRRHRRGVDRDRRRRAVHRGEPAAGRQLTTSSSPASSAT